MKRINRTSLLLSAMIVSGLVGCADKGTSGTGGTPIAGSSNEIVLGCIAPMTGTNADYGNQTKRGAELAVEEINAAGGINGKKLRIVYEDDQGLAKNGPTALQKLASVDKVPAVLGPFLSTVVIPTAKTAEQLKVVILSASATADSIKDAGDYTFRIVPTNAKQGDTAAKFALTNLRAKRAALMPINDDYGKTLSASFTKTFTAGGGQIVSTETFNAGTRDFRTLLTKVASANPDVVFFPGNYQETGTLLKQARQQGLKMAFLGTDGQVSPDFLKVAGSTAEGTYYTNMGLPASASAQVSAFNAAFKKKYNTDPTTFEAYAYDAMKILADVVKRGGTEADGIKKALYETKDFQGVSGSTTFDRDGEVDKDFAVEVVSRGQYVTKQH